MGWLTSWTFKKTVSLPVMSADQTDLNYWVEVTWQAGMNADFSDIRFCDSDEETLLYQYRKSYTVSTTARFAIKVPSVLAAGKTIYMYFGNSGASDVSDGANTFAFFDDFLGDLSAWTTVGNVAISGGNLLIDSVGGNLSGRATSNGTWGIYYSALMKVWHDVAGGSWTRVFAFDSAAIPIQPGYKHRAVYGAAYWSTGTANPASELDDEIWRELEIKRLASNNVECYFDGTLEAILTLTHTDAHPIDINSQAPSVVGDVKVDWVIIFKMPQDGTVIGVITPGANTSIGKINRDCKIAYEHTASVWGTAVEPGALDEIKVIDLGPLGEMREINLSKEAGYQWHQYAPIGKKTVEPEIKMKLRYSGREWSFLAQLMGLDTVGGDGPYTHTLSLLDAIDGSDAFGTLAAMLGYSTVGLRFEWPSLKPVKVAISGPDENGRMEIIVKGIADKLNFGTDTATDKSDFTNVSHMELNSVMAPMVPFGALRFRLNPQGGDALGSSDALVVIRWEFEFERKLGEERSSRAIYTKQWETAEPIENGIANQKLIIELGDLNNLTFAERFQDETELKADALFQLDANYSILFEFPRLRLLNIDPWIRNQNRINHKIELQPMLASAAPTGMTCTNSQVVITDDNGSAYE